MIHLKKTHKLSRFAYITAGSSNMRALMGESPHIFVMVSEYSHEIVYVVVLQFLIDHEGSCYVEYVRESQYEQGLVNAS